MSKDPKCSATKRDSTRCTAGCRPGRALCAFHDPSLAKRRAEGRRAGGVRRSGQGPRLAVLPDDTPDAALGSVDDVKAFLASTCNQVRKGTLAPQVGNCLACLTGQLLRALEGSEPRRELDAIKAILAARGIST
jgi:hypothetical protein